jgi:hypothetical protein
LDGLDLDFLTFGKGGVFQNLEEADFSFDDIGGFRLRGMSEIGLAVDPNQQMNDTRGGAGGGGGNFPQHPHHPHAPPLGLLNTSGSNSGHSHGTPGSGGGGNGIDFKGISPTHKMAHGTYTRDSRSGSLGWFDANTFLNERDPFLVKTYANADFSSHLEGGRISPSRHHSFDVTIPSSPVNLYTSDEQVLSFSPCLSPSLCVSLTVLG